MSDNEPMQELLDRTRRIETRLTRFMEDNGFDTKVRRAVWYPEEGRLEVPSPATSLKDIIAAVPRSWQAFDKIVISHKGDMLATIYLP